MKARRTISDFSLCELAQIAEALNRGEADLRERYKRLAEQAKDLLPARQQQHHPPKGTNHEH